MTDYEIVCRYQNCEERLQKLGLMIINDRGVWGIVPRNFSRRVICITSSIEKLDGFVEALEYKAKISEDKQEKPNGHHHSDKQSTEVTDHQRVCGSTGQPD
jgi:hypothetical protein